MTTTVSNNSISIITNPNKQEFVQLWKQGQAFIIDGVASNWKACKNWSNDYLVNVCGNNQVPVETYPENYFEGYRYAKLDNNDYYTTMTFAEYMDIVEGKKKDNRLYYLAQVDMRKYFPQLIEDIVLLDFFKKEPRDINLFFGFKKENYASTTKLHFDDVHNLFVQLRGRKRFVLFPQKNYLSFYPPLEDNYSATCSKVNPDQPDLEQFPKFPVHKKIEVILNPGEILYIPPFWWHHVTSLDENISLTFWYPPNITNFWSQKGVLSAFLQIAPHVIPQIIRSRGKRSLVLDNEQKSKLGVKA